MVFAYFLGQSIADVIQGRGSWADVAMNAAFLLAPAVGGAAIAKVAKKFANAADDTVAVDKLARMRVTDSGTTA